MAEDEKAELTPEAKAEIAEAIRIVSEDRLFRAIHSHYQPKPPEGDPGDKGGGSSKDKPAGDPPPPSKAEEEPPPPPGNPPPPKKEEPTEPPKRRGLWWGDQITDEKEEAK